MRRIFAEIDSSWVPYTTFKLFRFWLPICGDTVFIFEKWLPAITNTGCRRLPASLICGVGDSPHHRYESRLLNFLKENSLYWWCGESSTPRTNDMVSRRLPESLSLRVADSAYHWYGESTTLRIVESGVNDSVDRWYGESLFKEKINLVPAKPCL